MSSAGPQFLFVSPPLYLKVQQTWISCGFNPETHFPLFGVQFRPLKLICTKGKIQTYCFSVTCFGNSTSPLSIAIHASENLELTWLLVQQIKRHGFLSTGNGGSQKQIELSAETCSDVMQNEWFVFLRPIVLRSFQAGKVWDGNVGYSVHH